MVGKQPRHLCNHCLRVYILGSLAVRQTGQKFDEELAFVASALHDIGLVDEFSSADQRFEVDGADTAAKLMRERGMSEKSIELVWDAIVLHNSMGIAQRKSPESALVLMGAGADVAGFGLDTLPPAMIEELLEALPIIGFPQAFSDMVSKKALEKPFAHMFTWAADVAIGNGHPWPCQQAAQQIVDSPWSVRERQAAQSA
jgi:hypothetical protein|tara:strand:- start:698 stop:1297 length:600 start_codon:yes stop_codon:yes gene_type:complete